MVSRPHGGRLVQVPVVDSYGKSASQEGGLSLEISEEVVATVENIASGTLSPLDGFMSQSDYQSVLDSMRLSDDTPWTLPIVLHVPEASQIAPNDKISLVEPKGAPIASLQVEEIYRTSRKEYAKKVFGTEDPAHPGVARVLASSDRVASGRLKSIVKRRTPYDNVTLSPKETRVLFRERGWNDVIAFQTRNAPHVGHEYVQKVSLLSADGLFINPVLGKKKPGDFKDDVIVDTYKALVSNYYPRNSVVLSVLHYEMQYAGPREAIMHAIMRKNFGCTKIAIGRDHAGVGNYYSPYAAHEIFKQFPDLGIEPVLMREFYYCTKCGGIANERICPHTEREKLTFSGTALRKMFQAREAPPKEFMRPEVAQIILDHKSPFVE